MLFEDEEEVYEEFPGLRDDSDLDYLHAVEGDDFTCDNVDEIEYIYSMRDNFEGGELYIIVNDKEELFMVEEQKAKELIRKIIIENTPFKAYQEIIEAADDAQGVVVKLME